MSGRAFRTVLTLLILGVVACAFALGLIAGAGRARAEIATGSWWQAPAVRACCSDADAVFADDWRILPDGSIRATVTGGGPRNHDWAPIGREYVVPADRILREPGNPTGRPLLFLRRGDLHLYCFAMGAGI